MPATNPDGRERSIERFNAALTRINASILAGDATDEVLAVTAERAEEIADRLAAGSPGRLWGVASNRKHPDALAFLLIGVVPHTALIDVGTLGSFAEGSVTFDGRHEGPPGFAHGGIIASLFDDLCAAAQRQVDSRHSLTHQLEITYHRPTPLDRSLRARAEVTDERERSVTVRGSLHDGDTALVEATATFRRPGSPQ